ncbi:MAG: ABC transporter ATP-binding protein [Candidatus Rokubacteria bacterium]|nr:ABC transporter ATP-binding protein [Candidatus Rokubacteria bacterium]MBI3825127.1 ABC transporter ATP-binding protein [Candidatus Rokubacteria bacterium]
MSVPPLLALRQVRVVYGGRDALVVDALEARAREVLAIIGPNGSGKSTLLRVMGLLEAPAAGEVLFHGRAVSPAGALAERRRMTMVFQQPLLADMTVAANVALGLRFRGVDGAEIERRTARWLERFNVAPLADRQARTLSGGEAQRVALARALVLEPEVLLLDEPFSSLDEPTRAALLGDLGAILRDERVATILVTHDRGEAQALADRVAVLIAGMLRQVGPTTAVFQAPVAEDVARFVGVETIVSGEVVGVEEGISVVDVAGCKLEVAGRARLHEQVRICVRPEDVTLVPADGTLAASSARNRLPGVVRRVRRSTQHLHLVIDCGFPLVAAVTPRSVEELGLGEGAAVVAVFKASAAHLIPRAGALLDTRPGAGL